MRLGSAVLNPATRLGPVFVDTATPGPAIHQHRSRRLVRVRVHIAELGPAARLSYVLVESVVVVPGFDRI